MPKNFFQDMVKDKRERTGTKSTFRQSTSVSFQETKETGEPKEVRKVGKRVEANGGSKRYAFWVVAGISVIFFLFSLSYLFSSATVKVNPKKQDITLNESLSAIKDGRDALSFDLVIISGEESKTITTTEEKEVAESAKGTVLIYNTFSSANQKLDIDTRLEGSNGKIYKTQKAITVPGMMKDGKPGSVEVQIYAALAGPEYNSAPLDFKIFGFKGTAKYSKFYGRSKEAITGGLKGKYPFISDDQKTSIVNELKTSLEAKLFQKANDQIPGGFILFKDAVFLKVENENFDFSSSEGNIIPVELKGALYGILFNENKLIQKIVENNIDEYDGNDVYINNIQDLVFSISNKDNIEIENVKNIDFNLKGATQIVWELDVEKFITELVGRSRKNLNQILLQYKAIESAKSSISPFWKQSFPDKFKNIKVIVNYPE